MNLDQLIVALDDVQPQKNLEMMEKLSGLVSRVKVGSVAFSSAGPSILEHASRLGFKVFLDLKFYDIPSTVTKAVQTLARFDCISFFTVHASGGPRMMEMIRKALNQLDRDKQPKMLAVTLLTSFEQSDLGNLGLTDKPLGDHVRSLARMAIAGGSDGIVCSAFEVKDLREQLGEKPVYMVPGIRLLQDNKNDQSRVMDPRSALDAGASYLVVGRSITHSEDPIKTIEEFKNL